MAKKPSPSAELATFDIPEECANKDVPTWQRVDIFLSAEYDAQPAAWRDERADKAAYMNDTDNRDRATEALGII